MNTWRLVFAATVLTGCTASIGAPTGSDGTGGNGKPSGPGANGSGATGSGATGSGATGSGATGSGATGSGATGSGATGSGGTSAGPNGSGGSSGSLGSSGGGTAVTCTPGVPTTSQIPRLTNDEYDRTIRDLLGVTTLTAANGSTPSNLLATDQAGGLTDVGWAAYKTVAEDIAGQVMADATLKTKFITCDPSASKCLHDTAVSFGRKAFRRPLSTDEVAEFDTIIASGADITPTGAPSEVAEALLYMFLISPSFLQREELQDTSDGAGHYNLSAYEVASRLSYTLWGSTPDDTLNQAADTQQLATPAQILTQAQRMIADPRARDMTQAFHRYYMLMGLNTRWDNTNKDPSLFPAFNKGLVPAMQQETEMFFDNIVFAKSGTFDDLLTSTTAFVSAATAPLYGLDPSKFGAGLSETTLDANHPGFLTRLGFLNAYSGYSGTSPILRGAFITKQVLGIAIGAPPPGAEQTPLPDSSATLDTNRKRYDALTAGSACSGCHHPFINPPGFALEAFNTVGSWQTVEAGTNAPIDSTADIALDATGDNTVHVTGPKDLMAAIAAAPGAKAQYASKWVSFAYGREGDANDACTVQQLATKMTTGGYSVLNLMADLTQTLSFRVRVAGQ
jgi:hypothetical protein